MIGRFLLGFVSGAAAVTWLRRPPAPTPTEIGTPGSAAGRTRLDANRRRLIGIITHELRTPTSVIMGYQELLSEGLLGPVNPRVQEGLDRIRRAAAQLRDLTEGLDILTGDGAGRPEAGGEVCDFNAIASLAVDACAGDAAARGIALRCEATGTALVRASAETLGRLADLLVTAAVRTATGSSITVVVAKEPHGITARTEGASFDATHDGPALTAQPDAVATGIGLRLAIAQRLAHTVGGAITLENGQFHLLLPAAVHR